MNYRIVGNILGKVMLAEAALLLLPLMTAVVCGEGMEEGRHAEALAHEGVHARRTAAGGRAVAAGRVHARGVGEGREAEQELAHERPPPFVAHERPCVLHVERGRHFFFGGELRNRVTEILE